MRDHPISIAAETTALGTGPLELSVADVADLTPRIRRFVLRAPAGDELPEWTPGAHLDLPVRLSAGNDVRSYSLMGDCRSRDRYEIAVLRDDAGRGGSLAMNRDYHVGRIVRCNPPTNQFDLHTDARPSVLIAGGIGITPIRSMAIELQRRGTTFTLHYATRSVAETALMQDLADRFGTKVTFSISDGSDGHRLNVREVMRGIAQDGAVYVCGPLGLIQAVVDAADGLDLPRSSVRYERFTPVAPEMGDHAFDVVLERSSRTVRVRQDETILDAILAAGIQTPFGCRTGQCGACAVDILEGEADHRDTALNEVDRGFFGCMCICVSRAKGDRLVIDL